MLINAKKLFDLPVYTKSGQLLGEVCDIELETEGQLVVNYLVGSQNAIKSLFGNKLVINRNQVISIEADKMIVDDNVYTQRTQIAKEKNGKAEISEGAIASVVKSGE